MKIDDVVGKVVSQREPETSEISGDKWSISLPKTRIHTLEQLIEYCKIDLLLWQVDRFVVNKWEVGMSPLPKTSQPIVTPLFQVKAWLIKKQHVADALAEIEGLRKKADHFSPKYPKLKSLAKSSPENITEFSLYDHHFGALIWGRETGHADYDNAIAKACWEKALTDLVSRTAGYQSSKALLVLGNDQQNADNRAGMTERGTPQNMDSRYQKVFEVSRDSSIWAIDTLLGIYRSVDVVMVSGNHDVLATWHLGDSIRSWYRRCVQVTIDNEPKHRKYYEHGTNMLLFTHGSSGKLENYGATMAAEQPAMWGRTAWREAHTGDKHQRRVIEVPGATVRILPSLRPPCAWSSEQHFVGMIRAAEAYVWNRTEGLVGTAVHSILARDR